MYTPRVPTLTRAHHFHLLVWRPKSVCAPKIGGWHISCLVMSLLFKRVVQKGLNDNYSTKRYILNNYKLFQTIQSC